jgi:hypothetical protein
MPNDALQRIPIRNRDRGCHRCVPAPGRWAWVVNAALRTMRFLHLTRQQWLVLIILVFSYGAGYAWARSQRILIHRTSFATEGASTHYFHSVSTGDFGPGLLQGSVTPLVVSGCYSAFTPLRWLESLAWSFISRHEHAA